MADHDKTVLITGLSGQDGYYLAQQLLATGSHRVVAIVLDPNAERAMVGEELWSQVQVVQGDLSASDLWMRVLPEVRPDLVFHLGALSHVAESVASPMPTIDITGMAPIRLLEAVRTVCPTTRVLLPASAEIFGRPETAPQDEKTLINPHSPYGVAKTMAYCAARSWRQNYGVFASNAILFNHESPRRGENFVTRKITLGVAKIALGMQKTLELGNLDSCRDWGWAPDYMRGLQMILEHDVPDDFVLATGVTHSVREYCAAAFSCLGLNYEDYVCVNPAFVRPIEAVSLVGNPTKAIERLGWKNEVPFEQMVERMVRFDYDRLK